MYFKNSTSRLTKSNIGDKHQYQEKISTLATLIFYDKYKYVLVY